jgi:hypothetical protein
MSRKDLDRLLVKARQARMTPAQWEEQRRSFAYGNARIENERVTRTMVDQAAEKLAHEPE